MRLPVTFYPVSGPNHIYLDSYREWLEKQDIKPNTVRAYHSRVKQFLLFVEYASLSDEPLNDQSSMNKAMSLYLDFLKNSKQMARSVNANINALNNFSQFLGLGGTQLKRERCYDKSTRVLTRAEQEKFLDSVERQESARDKALAMVLFYTGIRIGDCACLNIEDIGAGAGSVCLANKARVALNKPTTAALRQWLEERKQLAHARADSGLWLTKEGERLSMSGIVYVIKRIGWQANLIISAEMLRRTWLTNLSDHFNKNDLASKFGGYISAATINRYGVSLPADAALSVLEH